MPFSPVLMFHITTAIIGLLSGYMSIAMRKGSSLHRLTGMIFFYSMVGMSVSGGIVATFIRPNRLNMLAASLTLYRVLTGWRAGKRREGRPGVFDAAALCLAACIAAGALIIGLSGAPFGGPRTAIFVFGTGALLLALSDIRMFRAGGLDGRSRVVRHLWRMCIALFIATMSLYPGQAKLFPQWLKDSKLLSLPMLILIGTMIFWRMRMRKRRNRPGSPTGGHGSSNDPLGAALRDAQPSLHQVGPAAL